MPGRKPIFASLLAGSYYTIRDLLFKATLEPESPEERKEKSKKKPTKSRGIKKEDRKSW